jgi:hypothetical protein
MFPKGTASIKYTGRRQMSERRFEQGNGRFEVVMLRPSISEA